MSTFSKTIVNQLRQIQKKFNEHTMKRADAKIDRVDSPLWIEPREVPNDKKS